VYSAHAIVSKAVSKATMCCPPFYAAKTAMFFPKRQEDHINVPKSTQHKQLGLVSCESNLINRIVHKSHLRIQHRIDALEIQQVALLYGVDIFDIVNS